MISMSKKEIDKFFNSDCNFIAGANKVDQIPRHNLPEIAFIGKSNVGKSSLINTILNKKSLARTSKTPGRTQQLNFFNLNDKIIFVDMPGYGFAQVSKKKVANWTNLIFQYLRGRVNLKRVFLLIDSRRGLKENDIEVMSILDEHAVNYQIILTKVDQIKDFELEAIIKSIDKISVKHTALHPTILTSSSRNKIGIDKIREEVLQFVKTK